MKLNEVTISFKAKTPTGKEYEDKNILKIELMADPSSSEFSRQEQSKFDYRGHFVSPNTPARGELLINSVKKYAYDVADVMDDDNYATVL